MASLPSSAETRRSRPSSRSRPSHGPGGRGEGKEWGELIKGAVGFAGVFIYLLVGSGFRVKEGLWIIRRTKPHKLKPYTINP